MGTTAPFFVQTFHYPDGRVLAGGKLWFLVAGSTSLPKQVFQDRANTIPLVQPLILDAGGTAPQYFLGEGLYKIIVMTPADVIVQTRDYVDGEGSGSGTDLFQVLTNADDTVPGFLADKIINSATVVWTEVDDAGSTKMQAAVQVSNILDGKVKATTTDATPGFLDAKIADTETVQLRIVDDKLEAEYIGPRTVSVTEESAPGFLADLLEDSATVTWTVEDDKMQAHVEPGSGDTYKVKTASSDAIPGWLSDKIKAGTGVTFTVTEDGVNGRVIHVNVSSADQGKVRVDADDISLRYLAEKIVAGSNITLTREVDGADARIRIAAFAAGSLGYEGAVRAFGDALSIGSSTAIQNVLSIELAAGTWDVTGAVSTYVVQSGVLPVQMRCNISNVSATIDYDGWDSWADRVQTGGGSLSQTIASKRYILSVPTTIYLCAQASSGTFSGGLMWGNLTARQAA